MSSIVSVSTASTQQFISQGGNSGIAEEGQRPAEVDGFGMPPAALERLGAQPPGAVAAREVLEPLFLRPHFSELVSDAEKHPEQFRAYLQKMRPGQPVPENPPELVKAVVDVVEKQLHRELKASIDLERSLGNKGFGLKDAEQAYVRSRRGVDESIAVGEIPNVERARYTLGVALSEALFPKDER
ncbi:MAG: hypothetical protein ACKVPX_05940 [Myxococcaceae bacterium]